MSHTCLGRIEAISFGYGGYQDCMLGLTVTLGGKGWGTQTFVGGWAWSRIKHDEHKRWSEAERWQSVEAACVRIDELLRDAKRQSVDQLKDVPVEATFEKGVLSSWRVLTEVIA